MKKSLFATLNNATKSILSVHHFGEDQNYTIITSILQPKQNEDLLRQQYKEKPKVSFPHHDSPLTSHSIL